MLLPPSGPYRSTLHILWSSLRLLFTNELAQIDRQLTEHEPTLLEQTANCDELLASMPALSVGYVQERAARQIDFRRSWWLLGPGARSICVAHGYDCTLPMAHCPSQMHRSARIYGGTVAVGPGLRARTRFRLLFAAGRMRAGTSMSRSGTRA